MFSIQCQILYDYVLSRQNMIHDYEHVLGYVLEKSLCSTSKRHEYSRYTAFPMANIMSVDDLMLQRHPIAKPNSPMLVENVNLV